MSCTMEQPRRDASAVSFHAVLFALSLVLTSRKNILLGNFVLCATVTVVRCCPRLGSSEVLGGGGIYNINILTTYEREIHGQKQWYIYSINEYVSCILLCMCWRVLRCGRKEREGAKESVVDDWILTVSVLTIFYIWGGSLSKRILILHSNYSGINFSEFRWTVITKRANDARLCWSQRSIILDCPATFVTFRSLLV